MTVYNTKNLQQLPLKIVQKIIIYPQLFNISSVMNFEQPQKYVNLWGHI